MENILQIKKWIEDGLAIRRISVLLNISVTQLDEIIAENKFTVQKDIFSEDKIPYIIELYKSGVSAKTLGQKYSIDKRRVQKWVKVEGILRTKKEAGRFIKFNENKFDAIDTPEKAYWLGFCYADAYNCQLNNTFHLTLKQTDYEHVAKFCRFMEISLDQICSEPSKNGKYFSSGVKLSSKHLCTKMAQLGCPQAKSFIIKFPMWLDKSLHSHFIRGMFDGDGSLKVSKAMKEWRWSLVSTKECCEEIKKIIYNAISTNVDYFYISKTKNNTYNFSTNGNEKVKTILDWLYLECDESIRLTRKHGLYLQLTEQQKNRRFTREKYKLSDQTIEQIKNDLKLGQEKIIEIAIKYNVHPRTVAKIKVKI